MAQVGSASVAIFPTFKGFRRAVSREVDGSANESARGFRNTFARSGSEAGSQAGAGFRRAFDGASKNLGAGATKALQAEVAKASRALSAARLKEQDAAGKARLAEVQLGEARKKYADGSSQVVRAEERQATALRQLRDAQSKTETSTKDLKEAQSDLASAADRAGDELADAGQRGVTGFRSNVVGGVKGFAGPLIAAFAALGIGQIVSKAFGEAKDFVLGSIDFASDLNESVNAVNVSFGEAAAGVLDLGKNSANAFGLSKGALNQYSVQLSGFVKQIAGTGGDVAGTLDGLLGRATDFASVLNLDVSDALQVFQSSLAGETEPIRKFGIDLSAAAVETYALEKGLASSSAGMTEAVKVQARYGLLMQSTAGMAGDFANTSDELANSQRILAARWEDAQAKLGGAFLPVAEQLVGILGDDLMPVVEDMIAKFGPELSASFEEMLPQLKEVAEDVLPLLPDLIQAMVDGIPPLIEGFAAVAPVLVEMTQNTAGFFNALQLLFDLLNGDISMETFLADLVAIPGPIGDIWRAASNMGTILGGVVARVILSVASMREAIGQRVNEVVLFFQGLPQRIMDSLGDLGSRLIGSGRALMDGFIQGIRDSPVGQAVSDVMATVAGFFPHSPAKRGPFSGSGWTAVAGGGSALMDQFQRGMKAASMSVPLEGVAASIQRGSGVAGAGAGAATVPRGPVTIAPTYNLAHEDPRVAAQLATDQVDQMVRRYSS